PEVLASFRRPRRSHRAAGSVRPLSTANHVRRDHRFVLRLFLDLIDEDRFDFSVLQPPARLFAIISFNMTVRAGALILSPWRIATVRAVLLSCPPVMMRCGSGTIAPSYR